MSNILQYLQRQLIVSCQAPVDSPLHDPDVISAIAGACIAYGVKAVRLDTPSHVKAVRAKYPEIIIIGLWKQMNLGSQVYITPRFEDAQAIAEAGADIIAIDATRRDRPNGESLKSLIEKIHQDLGKLVMADIDTLENAYHAVNLGVDLVGTTLYGYTAETKQLKPPGYDIISALKNQLQIPLICEGGIDTPDMTKKAFELGADAVVVGTAITGIDLKVQAFLASVKP
jgi:N-acylglucosamine-6-phosphate 2-epimerase